MNLYNLHAKPASLDHYDLAHETVPSLVWEKYKNQPAELKKREALFAKDAKTAYMYVLRVLQGRFPAGEAAIAKNAQYAYYYADKMLNSRFPAGEEAIATSALYSYYYASHVLRGRFLAGEAVIEADPEYAAKYEKYFSRN